MNKVLIDSDVILDFFLDRKPFSDDAAVIFSLSENHQITAFATPVIFSNVYYILCQLANHDKAVEKLRQLLQIIDVLTMDKTVVKQALFSSFSDFEDGLQHAAATNHGTIDAIITRNVRDYKKSEIAVFSPQTFLNIGMK